CDRGARAAPLGPGVRPLRVLVHLELAGSRVAGPRRPSRSDAEPAPGRQSALDAAETSSTHAVPGRPGWADLPAARGGSHGGGRLVADSPHTAVGGRVASLVSLHGIPVPAVTL